MSTWTFKALISAAALAALTGCVGSGSDAGRGLALFEGGFGGATPPAQATVFSGGFTVAGPDGFCVDRRSSRLARSDAPFVMMAPCDRIRSGVAGLIFRTRGLLTVTVTEGAGPSAQGYARFFDEPEGRAALSPSGDGGAVIIEASGARDDGSYRVTVYEGTTRKAEVVDARTWRAFLTVNDHLVALSLRSPSDAPLSAEQADRLLDGTVSALRAANPQAVAAAADGN